MKNYLSLAVCVFMMAVFVGCGNGSNGADGGKSKSQSPEDYVREKYGLPWASEEEYEAACSPDRLFEGMTLMSELEEWAYYYCLEDRVFEQKVAEYKQLYNSIESLAIGGLFNGGNEEKFKSIMAKAGYGNEAQCKALIEGLKKDGFLIRELEQMRTAHRERIVSGINPLCENLEQDIAYNVEGDVAPDHVKRVFITSKLRDGATPKGECPYYFYVNVEQNPDDERYCHAVLGNKQIQMHKEDGGLDRSEVLKFSDLALLRHDVITIKISNY